MRYSRAFTMIELVFVIVILGILAAVVMPRLAATRTDADAAATLSNFKNVVKMVAADAMSKGVVPDVSTIFPTNGGITTTATTVTAAVGSTTCATATINGNDLNITIQSASGDCTPFAGIVAAGYPLLGVAIVR
ncbi:MAG: type II secretion system protein [Sulfurimonas sp.]|uniref:type II secretion system protein n=1 Tax=Sulfurimonas sp. TaxID=2022749 RepID=UPI00260DB970|nr:type II secretion system protein [Sulfurimonas sp.]MDD5400712.1 type II secretion system protein [Sulfurimonas sp.]